MSIHPKDDSSVLWDITPCSQFEIIDISEGHITSIFCVEEKAEEENGMIRTFLLATCYMLLSYVFFEAEGSDVFI